MKHTDQPLQFRMSTSGWQQGITPAGMPVITCESGCTTYGQRDADMTRAIDCWNAMHGLDLPPDIPAGAVAALVTAAREALAAYDSRGYGIGEEAQALEDALALFTSDPAPPVSVEIPPDRRTVWSFEVDGQHVRWCGTLDQWHKDRLAYVDQSEGTWEAHGLHMWRFIEPGVNGGKPVKTIFRAVKQITR